MVDTAVPSGGFDRGVASACGNRSREDPTRPIAAEPRSPNLGPQTGASDQLFGNTSGMQGDGEFPFGNFSWMRAEDGPPVGNGSGNRSYSGQLGDRSQAGIAGLQEGQEHPSSQSDLRLHRATNGSHNEEDALPRQRYGSSSSDTTATSWWVQGDCTDQFSAPAVCICGFRHNSQMVLHYFID